MTQATWWLAYATTGKEFEVMDQLAEMDIDHWRGERIKFERRGKDRTPEPYTYPALPNYVFLKPGPGFSPRNVKHMAPLMQCIVDARLVERFMARSEAEKSQAERIQGNRAAIAEYTHGERVEIISGPLMGQFAAFERMVKGANDLFPKLRLEADLMGGKVPVDVDPLDVRRAG